MCLSTPEIFLQLVGQYCFQDLLVCCSIFMFVLSIAFFLLALHLLSLYPPSRTLFANSCKGPGASLWGQIASVGYYRLFAKGDDVVSSNSFYLSRVVFMWSVLIIWLKCAWICHRCRASMVLQEENRCVTFIYTTKHAVSFIVSVAVSCFS